MLNSRVDASDASDAARRRHLLQHTNTAPADALALLVRERLAELPPPGQGATLARWRALADVAAHDLSLVKLFEGHTDALQILRELGDAALPRRDSCWGMWAAEARDARVVVAPHDGASVRLHGRKAWCSGAASLSHALLTAWRDDGSGPWLVKVALDQPAVRVTAEGWSAVGMAASASVDVVFDGAHGSVVGAAGDYLQRPGFWHGGAGIAACWYGGTATLARQLQAALAKQADAAPLREAALGRIDVALRQTAALLREAAAWIDQQPEADARACALRVRAAAEQAAQLVLEQAGRALGAVPFCRDARFAQRAADLPVFVRQSGGDRDLAALGACVAAADVQTDPWPL